MSYLLIDSAILFLQFIVIITSGFILFTFYRVKRLYKNSTLRLTLFVAITDLFYSFAALPYTIYLFASCFYSTVNLDPNYIMFSSIPLTIQLKIKLTLTVAIAMQRTMVKALCMPVLYRRLSITTYATVSLLLGIMLACIDLLLLFALSPIAESPNCGTIGCFVSNNFLYYWGLSNMILGLMVVAFSFLTIMKLRVFTNKTKIASTACIKSAKEKDRFAQANRTSVEILLTSFLFMTIPSMGVGFIEMIGFSIFRKIGPFYTFSLLCAAACNGIIYIVLNGEMRGLTKAFLSGNGFPSASTVRFTGNTTSRYN